MNFRKVLPPLALGLVGLLEASYAQPAPIGTDVVVELEAPGFDMAYDEPRQRLYVSLPNFNELAIVSTETFSVVDRGSRNLVGFGQVLDTATFTQTGMMPWDTHPFGERGDVVHIAQEPDRLLTYDATSCIEIDERTLPCSIGNIDRLVVLPNEGGRIVLGDDLACAVVAGTECAGPPLPTDPTPASGAMDLPTWADLAWAAPTV